MSKSRIGWLVVSLWSLGCGVDDRYGEYSARATVVADDSAPSDAADAATPSKQLDGGAPRPECPHPDPGTWGGVPVNGILGNITVCRASYCPGYVCWNFANGFWWQARQQGLNVWVFIFGCTNISHAVNIIEVDCSGCAGGLHKFCVIEPQSNATRSCWTQDGATPSPPSFVYDQLRGCYNFYNDCLNAGNSNTPQTGVYDRPWQGPRCLPPPDMSRPTDMNQPKTAVDGTVTTMSLSIEATATEEEDEASCDLCVATDE